MPHTSTRLSSARLNDGRSATKENQPAEPNTASDIQLQQATQAPQPAQPMVVRGRQKVSTGSRVRARTRSAVHRQDTNDISSTNEPLGVLNRDTGESASPALQEDNVTLTSDNSEPNGNFSNVNVNHDDRTKLDHIREERDRLLAEVQSLRIRYDTSRPSQSSGSNQAATEPALIPRPEGRRIRLQEDMGLANDRIRFLSIRRTMKDVLNRAGLDCKVRWEHQPKEKLAKIFWIVKDRQPYLKRFAHNWPIEEYIKRHHKHIRAYLRRIADDGTNMTIPNVCSEEISDSQGEIQSDSDMLLDDL